MKNVTIIHWVISILCVFFLFQTIYGFQKGNYFFPETDFKSLTLKEINKDSTDKIVKTSKDYRNIFGLTAIIDTVNHFYSSDIDNDGSNEIIYYGLTTAEGYWTVIWKVENQSYELLGELYGKIIGIDDSLHISTLAPPFKDSDCGYAHIYRITDDWIGFERSVMIFKGVSLPDSPPIRKKIVINRAGCSLRTQPIVNNTPDSSKMERYGVLRGNAIVELEKGISASATARFKDRSRREWLFLVLDNPPNAGYNVYKRYKKEDRSICGWIRMDDTDE